MDLYPAMADADSSKCLSFILFVVSIKVYLRFRIFFKNVFGVSRTQLGFSKSEPSL